MRLLKRILALLLSAALLAVLPAPALAAEGELPAGMPAEAPVLDEPAPETVTEGNSPAWDGGEESARPAEQASGETAEGNIRYAYADGVLRLYGTGPMADYDADNLPPWLENSSVWKRIRAVVVEEGITSIGNCAFAMCRELQTIQLPEGITRIGDSAFQSCQELFQIDLPEGVAEIGQAAFYNCSQLTRIGLPASLTRIGDLAFGNCGELQWAMYGGTAVQLLWIDFGLGVLDVLAAAIWYGRIPHCTVTFDSQGGSPVLPASVPEFDYAIRPVDPVRPGMRFDGWYREPACVHAFDFFEEYLEEDVTLYAKWTSGESISVAPEAGKFLPAELDTLSVRTILGEENYAACLEKYGPDAVVQIGLPGLGIYETLEGGLDGIPQLSNAFYVMSEGLQAERLPFAAELLVGRTATAMDTDRSSYGLSFAVYFMDEIFDISLAAEQADGTRTALEDFSCFQEWDFEETSYGTLIYNTISGIVFSPAFVRENTILAGLRFQDGFDHTDCRISVYSGWSINPEKYPEQHPELEITGQIWNQGDLAAGGGFPLTNSETELTGSWAASSGMFTILLQRNGVTQVVPTSIYMFPQRKMVRGELYASAGELKLGGFKVQERTDGVQTDSFQISSRWEYTANSDLWLRLTFSDTARPGSGGRQGIDFVSAAYEGLFQSEAEALEAGADNIRDLLFTAAGYRSNYSGGVTFTIVDTDGELHYYRYVVEDALPGTESEKPVPGESDTYFDAYGVRYGGPHSPDFYMDESSVCRKGSDSYYYNGYQTVFLLDKNGDGLPAGTDIYPEFVTGSTVSVYAGQYAVDEPITSGVEQRSGESRVTLTSPVTTVQYSAASENHVCLKNYWVSYVTRSSGGGKLYVNGATNAIDAHRDSDGNPRRVVVLDSAHAYTHEIFLANIGDAPLSVSVTLEDAVGVTLDPYWTGSGVLPAFINSWDNDNTGMPDNATKIMLRAEELPDGSGFYEGPISGRLTISAGNGETVTIDLSGCAGSFDFITEAMGDAVLYVPYDQVIQNSSTGHSAAVTYRLVGGALPDGLQLYPNGVVYGVPMAMGTYTFTAAAQLTGALLGLPDEQVEKEFTLTVLENTDSNVWTRTDMDEGEDYRITIAIPNQDGSTGNINLGGQVTAVIGGNSWSNQTMLLETQGTYARFRNVYLDGRRLTAGTDYTSDEGSTRITLRTATLAERGAGRHTLAAEFYESRGEDGTMRKASQNFNVSRASGGLIGGNTGSNNGGSPSSGTNQTDKNKPQTVKPAQPAQPAQPAVPAAPVQTPNTGMPFTDVLPQHWFFSDVKWAYDSKYMNGVSQNGFAPNTAVTQAMIVTVLGRMAKIDTDSFTGASQPGIEGGKWYTEYALWARQSGLLPASGSFTGAAALTRNDMAIMLVKYLRGAEVTAAAPSRPVSFTDAAQMTEEGREAFEILYANNIFKGVGGGRMDPAGSATRAQFCALIHRISDLAGAQG